METNKNNFNKEIEEYLQKLIQETGGDLNPNEDIEFLMELENARDKTLKEIRQKLLDNQDNQSKHVGDVVRVWDTSRLTYAETDQHVINDIEQIKITNHDSIVVEDDCDYVATVRLMNGNFDKVLDLKIWNRSTKKIYRTSSDFVKLVS